MFPIQEDEQGSDSRSNDYAFERHRSERQSERWISQGATHTILMKGIPSFAEEKDVGDWLAGLLFAVFRSYFRGFIL